MLGRLLGSVFMAAICGFAALVVGSMIVTGYIGGPARPFATGVMHAMTSGLEDVFGGQTVWLQHHF